MEAMMMLVALPLMLLNFLAGLVGGTALLIQGEWRLVVGGLIYGVAGPFLLSFAMIPAMLFLPLGAWAERRGNTIGFVLAALPNMAWTYLIVLVSCVFIFQSMVAKAEGEFFHLLWAYSVTTAPWSFLAKKDRETGNDASTTLMFFVQLGTVSMMVATWIEPYEADVYRLAQWFFPFLILGLVFQVLEAWARVRAARRYTA